MVTSPGGNRNSFMVTAVVILLLSLMGAGVGFSVGMLLQPTPIGDISESTAVPVGQADMKSKDTGEELISTAAEESKEEAELDPPADPELKIIPLPPVLTTLTAPPGKWVRLEGVLLAKPGAATQPELLAERAGEHILAYLRTVRLEQLQGPSGFLALRDDLNETVRALSNGEAHSVLIHGLLIE
jgi:flagellar FliL protein